MEEFPRNLAEFERWFATDEACREYLCRLRWPEGFRCPRCGHAKAWPVAKVRLECSSCGHQVSVTAGTIFQDTHKPLTMWFRAVWWVTTQKNGASALGLQRMLGFGSYQTAWTWLHKLRRAMVRPDRDRLGGRVEVDEMYWGAQEEGWQGREHGSKTLIVIAAQEDGRKIGRIRLGRVPDASAQSLEGFIAQSIEPGSAVHTDGWSGYSRLKGKGYRHEATLQTQMGVPGIEDDLLPRAHRVVTLLRRWLMGTHQGAISPEHLDYYLDEFTFRFNRRTSTHRGKLFYRLLQQAVAVDPAPYGTIIKHLRGRPRKKHKLLG
jgi:transposase-like protein